MGFPEIMELAGEWITGITFFIIACATLFALLNRGVKKSDKNNNFPKIESHEK